MVKSAKIERPKQISEVVLEQLRSDIVDNSFALGEKLSENTLAERYGVTKAPIRAAFGKLQSEGLVEVRPQSGTYVFEPDADFIAHLCQLRVALELEAAHLALTSAQMRCHALLSEVYQAMEDALEKGQQNRYQSLDTEFHRALLRAANSPLLSATYEAQVSSSFAALRHRFSQVREHNEASVTEHRQLCDLVKAGDLDGTQELLRRHIENTRVYFDIILKKQRGMADA